MSPTRQTCKPEQSPTYGADSEFEGFRSANLALSLMTGRYTLREAIEMHGVETVKRRLEMSRKLAKGKPTFLPADAEIDAENAELAINNVIRKHQP